MYGYESQMLSGGIEINTNGRRKMHRKHVINSIKKHLTKHFQFGYEAANSFGIYNTKSRNVLTTQSVQSITVGVLTLRIKFENGSSFKVYCKDLESITYGRGDNSIVINNTIRFPLEGKVCPATI